MSGEDIEAMEEIYGLFKVLQLAGLGPKPKSPDSWSSSQLKKSWFLLAKGHPSMGKILSLELVIRRLSITSNSGSWKHFLRYRYLCQVVGK